MAGTQRPEFEEETIPFEDIASVFDKFQNDSENLDNVELNIAVTGETGSGKSTFVNAFRGLKNKDVGAAPTGVTETTMKPTPYPHPKYQKVTLWDLPGIGSQNCTADTYLQRVHFERYDFFIIVTSERFKECHVKLAKEINKVNKKFYFIRTKIDQDIRNATEDGIFDSNKTLEDIRSNCRQELKKAGLDSAQVFLISSCALDSYDFSLLHQIIEMDLLQLKKDRLWLVLSNISLEIHEKKKEALQASIWKMSLLSAGATVVPIAGISVYADMTIIIKELRKYYKALGLDEQSLETLAKKSGTSLEGLKSNVKSALLDKIDSGELIKLLSRVAAFVIESVAKHYLSLIPGLGSLAAGALSFATIYCLLRHCLNDLTEDAKNVLLTALEQPFEKTK
ncbi:interferon-inducible GTPase 5-like [Chanos chanos]|uniref:Interferon-inducible GTPase 5-like n=1 Tax=Chanos chanos TaxID=29144 RepID=A0A6J2UR33_CHACN|nr:interferon-inducible GTPase 5-like [Chanos chanos]